MTIEHIYGGYRICYGWNYRTIPTLQRNQWVGRLFPTTLSAEQFVRDFLI